MAKQPASIIYGLNEKPPFMLTLFLAIQHCLLNSTSLLFPAIIISAAMGSDPLVANQLTQMTLFLMGVGSICMVMRKRWLGTGYLCPSVAEPAYLGVSIIAVKMGGPALLFGMGLMAGFAEMIIALSIQFVRKLFPTEVTGVVVIMIGVNLITPMLESSFHFSQVDHIVWSGKDVFLFVATFLIIVLTSIWGPKKVPFYSILIASVVGYVLAIAIGKFPAESILLLKQASFFSLPSFSHAGDLKFSSLLILPFIVGALSAAIKAMGNISTAQASNDAEWSGPEIKTIRSGILTESLFTILSGLLGGLPMGTGSANVGYARASGITSRYIGFFMGGLFIVVALVPKISYVLVLMPAPVRGALLAYVICYMIVAGLQIVVSRMIDARKTLVIGLSLGLGLTVNFIPAIATAAPGIWQPILGSPLTVATLAAFILNMLFRIGITKKVTQIIEIHQPFNQKVWDFLQLQGAKWGALPNLIRSATEAIIECLEAIKAVDHVNKAILQLYYDEYNLSVRIIYDGPIINLETDLPTRDLINEKKATQKLALALLKSRIQKIKTHLYQNKAHIHFIVKSID